MEADGPPVLQRFAEHVPEAAGYSLVQLIETSAITGHFCDKSGDAYIDVFSCKDFDTAAALDVVRSRSGPSPREDAGPVATGLAALPRPTPGSVVRMPWMTSLN